MSATLTTRKLPRTGQSLTALGLGGAPLGNLYSLITEAQARETFDAAWNAGIRFFDTAPLYGHTLSEHRFGAALRDHPRDEWLISSKVGRLLKPVGRPPVPREMPPGESTWLEPLPFEVHYDYTASAIRRSLEDSLQRLGVNHIDVALVHDIGRAQHGDRNAVYWQQLTQGGGFRELEQLKREGLVGAIGLGVNEWEVILEAMQHVDLDTSLLAGRYTLLEQASLHPFLSTCVQRGVGLIVGGPFNSGILAAGIQGGSGTQMYNYASAPAEIVQRVAALQAVCASFDVPLAAAALQFPLAHPAVASVVPGARSADDLRGIVGWMNHPIPQALWTALRAQGLVHADAPLPGAD